jgi:hypothetical protein
MRWRYIVASFGPSFDVTRGGPALYVPRAFNLETIDGIIVWIAPKPNKREKRKSKKYSYSLFKSHCAREALRFSDKIL